MSAVAPHPTKIFRRNTSGIIGLRKEAEAKTTEDKGTSKPFLVQSNSSNVSPATLEIRENAARRISAHEPPVLEDLEIPASSSLSAGDAAPKIRKTSEIVRPNFSIYEERESQGMFVSGILNERSDGCSGVGAGHNVTFSFSRESSGKDLDLVDDFSSIDLNDDESEEDRMSTGSGSSSNNNNAPPKFSFVGRFDLHGRRDSSEDILPIGFVPRF